MNGSNIIKNIENKEVSIIYKIFEELYLKAPHILKDVSNIFMGFDNEEYVNEQIDFKKIETKFKNGEYCFITDAIKDIRTVFLNFYSFYGARSDHTKKLLELEELLEEKISNLDKKYKSLADVKLTFNLLNMEGKPSSNLRYPKDLYDSVLLRSVAHGRPERLKKNHETLSTILTTDKDNAHIFEKVLIWENEVNFDGIFHQYISSMWELPEIGNFVAILFKKLKLDIINQVEIERMFIMPKESTTMSKIMTTLFMPVEKTKFISPVMSYKVWSEKLSKNVSEWCKVYHIKKQNKVSVMNSIGIHPDFWSVVNYKNPLIENDYSELSYFTKVWLVKGLCDHVTVKFKKIHDIVTNCNERHCTIWKNDLGTEEYFFINSMPDLRVYYHNIPYDEPCLEFLESVQNVKEVVKFEDNLTVNGFHKKRNENNFKLVADSVKGLRSFVNEIDVEGTSVPENLINSLENFIAKIELEEYKYITMNNDSRLKLYKDWISYPNKIQKDNDISFCEEKDSNSITQAKNEELIILEKRQRKLIVKQNFNIVDSDEYISENDKSLTDYTDSGDEWGAINQPKNKVKQSLQTPSKLLPVLEKQAKEAEQMLKYGPSNMFDTNQSDKYNQHDKTLVRPKNKSFLKKKNSNSMVQDQYSENKKSLFEATDSEDEEGAMNQPKDKVLQPLQTSSKHLKLKKRSSKPEKILKYDINHTDEMQLCDKSKNIQNRQITPTKYTQHQAPSSIIHKSSQNITNMSANVNTPISISNDVQLFSTTVKPKCPPMKTNLNKSYTSVSTNRQITPTKYNQHQAPSSIIHKSSQNITNMSANVNTPISISNDVQLFSTTVKPKCPPMKTNLNKSYTSVSTNRQITPTKYNQHQAPSSIIHKSSQNITNMSANVNTPISISNDVQLFSTTVKPKCPPMKTNLNKSYTSVSTNRQITPTKYNQHQAPSSIIHKSSQNITNMSANVNTPISISNDVQLFSTTVKPKCPPMKTNLNKSYTSVSTNRQITPTKYNQHQAPSSIIHKSSQNITNMSANVNTPISISNDVQLFSTTVKPKCPPMKTNLNKSYTSVSTNRQITPTKYNQHQAPSSIIQKLSQNVSIMPSNINIPKGIEVTMVKNPQTRIDSNINLIQRNGHLQDDPFTIKVKCDLISMSNFNGEVKFYVKLPNGTEQDVPNELINQYLNQNNNQLPDYWLVPLAVEIAK